MTAIQTTPQTQVVVLSTGDAYNDCDRCGTDIPAQWVVLLPTGGMLAFCGHHTRELGFRPGPTTDRSAS